MQQKTAKTSLKQTHIVITDYTTILITNYNNIVILML